MSDHKLADKLGIPLPNATKLMTTYFTLFPSIKASLDKSAAFGIRTGMMRSMPPFRRIRWFPTWTEEMLEYEGRQKYFKEIGEIERKSKNHRIQASGADQCKVALTLCRRWIREMKVPVKLVLQVHDEIDSICHRDYAYAWSVKLKELMEEAAREVIVSGLLKAEVTTTDCWQK